VLTQDFADVEGGDGGFVGQGEDAGASVTRSNAELVHASDRAEAPAAKA
jgi:hypothetical protein